MSTLQISGASAFFLMIAFCWVFYFRRDMYRWWKERGPRRLMAEEAAREREAELQRLRDELASKYLPPQTGTPPANR